MADVLHGVLLAAGLETGGAVNTAIRDLSEGGGPYTPADGFILGDADSGDDGTGITLPDLERDARAVPDVAGSLTPNRSTFDRVLATGLTISAQLKGNGASRTGTPGANEAKPDPGIDALFQASGLDYTDGNEAATYTPSAAGFSDKTLTIRYWAGGQTWLLTGCVVETLSIPLTGGETSVWTATIRVGAVDESQHRVEAPPEISDWGAQATLTPPRVQDAQFQYGATEPLRSFGNLTVEIANAVEDLPDSDKPNGIRLALSERRFNFNGELWMDDGDPGQETDLEWQQLIDGNGSPHTAFDMDWRVGVLTTGSGQTYSGMTFSGKQIEISTLNYTRAGNFSQAVIDSHATNTAQNAEFELVFG